MRGGFHHGAGAGDAWSVLDITMTLKAGAADTAGACTLFEVTAPVGFGSPRHIHRAEDEALRWP
ncbi:hypothetical protein [Streptosporangium sp. OZ121]|uniref:hypothetical protein n=1 Tax=Streptosporangium sp. OZ121 TaxID=3444183 RepID=UPI003F7A95E1